MSRRPHTTELGSIACEELGDVGAGKEGWLVNDPNILTALDTHSLAIANRSLILILHWSNGSEPNTNRLKIIPDLSPIEAECISALEWLVYDDLVVLAVGTSCGFLLIYSLEGELIHSQLVNTEKIIRLRVRGTKRDSTEDGTSEELCIVMQTTIARFDGADIQRGHVPPLRIMYIHPLSFTTHELQSHIMEFGFSRKYMLKSMLKRWFQENQYHQFWDETSDNRYPEDAGNSRRRLPYQLWSVSKYGACADAAITGIMPPPLTELQSTQRYYSAVAIGDDAVISAYRLSEDRNRSIVGAILSKVVPMTFSTITSISKMIWRSDTSTKKPEAKPQPFARASALTCLKDHPRKGEKLTLSPSGTLAAITDSLGRILLLDTQALVVVRLWKGYRNASCLFVELLVKKDSAMLRPAGSGNEKSDYCLCLAIHAPRKGIVEVWQMRTGPRLLTIPCPKGSKILQPTYRFVSSIVSSLFYSPLEVFLLNGDSGQLSVLNRTL